MSTTHHPNETNTPVHHHVRLGTRPAQCLRHHVWMAACPECHDARLPRQRVGSDR